MNETNILKNHVGYWLNRLRNVVHYSFEQRLAKYGTSVAEWCVLVCISDGSASGVNEIANYIEVDKAAVSRVVERLKSKRLLSDKAGADRRSRILEITQEGVNLISILVKEAEENEKQFFGHLSQLDEDRMRDIMHSILQKDENINLSGWIINENNEVYMNEILNILNEAWDNKWPYPKTFQVLKEAGLRKYSVRFTDTYQSQFIGEFGEFKKDALEGYAPVKAASKFDAVGIKNAIINHVKESTHYHDFLRDVAAHGCTHYKVDMNDRSVKYYNHDESECHVEHVPEYS
jgi:DNA-binding MarR family transcriptional regulator